MISSDVAPNPGKTHVAGITSEGRPCNGCSTWKPWEAFHRRANGRHGRAATCAACLADRRPDRTAENARARERYQANPEVRRAEHRRHVARTYGLEPGEFDVMLIAQSGRCWTCTEPMRKPCVDHDHSTGRVRKLLCYGCNVALGLVDDSIPRLLALVAYVEEHQWTESAASETQAAASCAPAATTVGPARLTT